jgi:hypothetical protein
VKKIAIICAGLIVIMAAILVVLAVFDMMTFDSALSNLLKVGAAIIVLGVASALISLMMGTKGGGE